MPYNRVNIALKVQQQYPLRHNQMPQYGSCLSRLAHRQPQYQPLQILMIVDFNIAVGTGQQLPHSVLLQQQLVLA